MYLFFRRVNVNNNENAGVINLRNINIIRMEIKGILLRKNNNLKCDNNFLLTNILNWS